MSLHPPQHYSFISRLILSSAQTDLIPLFYQFSLETSSLLWSIQIHKGKRLTAPRQFAHSSNKGTNPTLRFTQPSAASSQLEVR